MTTPEVTVDVRICTPDRNTSSEVRGVAASDIADVRPAGSRLEPHRVVPGAGVLGRPLVVVTARPAPHGYDDEQQRRDLAKLWHAPPPPACGHPADAMFMVTVAPNSHWCRRCGAFCDEGKWQHPELRGVFA